MTNTGHQPIKLFQFPRVFGIPNLSPFCCKLETWLRIAQIPYEVVDTPDPRKGPRGKLPFIEDDGVRIAGWSHIFNHLVRTRDVDPDARLDDRQRAVALLNLASRLSMRMRYRARARRKRRRSAPEVLLH